MKVEKHKNMDKYYTPELEEFHVGFEYESLEKIRDASGRTSWNKWTLKNAPSRLAGIHNIYFEGKEDKLRVKHLDREDIESLGAIKGDDVHGGKHPSYDSFILRRQEKQDNFILLFNYTDNWLTVYTEGNTEDIRFYGTIKNKSVLTQVLKMIGV